MTYKCSKCKLAVIVIPNEEPIRACRCNAAIEAEMSAHATGNGGMQKFQEALEEKKNGSKNN